MPKICLLVEYDGSHFSGWQHQPGKNTIQKTLNDTLSTVLKENITSVIASGRTDAGVHARAQVVTFRSDSFPELSKVCYSVNSLLNGKIAILDARFVDEAFHPQRHAKQKQYTYTVLNRLAPPTFQKGYVWYIVRPLNEVAMHQEARSFIGTHDFTSFRASSCTAPKPEKTIIDFRVERNEGDCIHFSVVGNGFLQHMVRIMVGTLIDLERKKLKINSIKEILEKKDRNYAGITAPPRGLYLDWVRYEET